MVLVITILIFILFFATMAKLESSSKKNNGENILFNWAHENRYTIESYEIVYYTIYHDNVAVLTSRNQVCFKISFLSEKDELKTGHVIVGHSIFGLSDDIVKFIPDERE